jgi:glycosyltransferase involved in cell wall biosynthesis
VPRVLLLTPAELTRDPRARRQATAALASGVEVVGLCGRISGEAPDPLDGLRVRRVGPSGRTDPAWEAGLADQRPAAAGRELRGLYRLGRLLVRTVRLWRAGRSLGRFDVVHANDLDTLPAAWLLARRHASRLVYDAHELYAEYEADPPRLARAATTALERVLGRRADAVVTVNEPIAAELAARLRPRRPPLVVLNAPEREPVEPSLETNGPLRAIYQGAFGPGRPLADLLDALVVAPGVELTVRAVRIAPDAVRAEIARRGLQGRVEVAEPLPPGRLLDGLRGAEVGVIFDRPQSRNSELSLPNKLFEYLMAGLAVAVPDLPALASLVEAEGVGVVFAAGRPHELGAALERLAADRTRLAELRRRAADAAWTRLNAEAQRGTLLRAWGLPTAR